MMSRIASSVAALLLAIVLLLLVLFLPMLYDMVIVVLVGITSLYAAKTVASVNANSRAGKNLRFLCLVYILANLLNIAIIVVSHFEIVELIPSGIIRQQIDLLTENGSIVEFSSLLVSVVAAAAATNSAQNVK